MLTKLYLAQKR